MTNIVLHATSGPDGMLHLEVPVGAPNTDFDVEVVARPKPPVGPGWPPDYVKLFNSIDDETFTVHPQPPLPVARPEVLRRAWAETRKII